MESDRLRGTGERIAAAVAQTSLALAEAEAD